MSNRAGGGFSGLSPIGSLVSRTKQARERAKSIDHAGFWLRVIGFLIDALLMVLLQKGLISLLGNSASTFLADSLTNPSSTPSTFYLKLMLASSAAWLLFIAVVPTLYYVIFESSALQGTPGKAIVGLKVTNEEGDRIGFFQSILRQLAKLAPLFPIFAAVVMAKMIPGCSMMLLLICVLGTTVLFPISYLMAAFTHDKQALHDTLAHTLVIKRESFSAQRVLISLLLVLGLAGVVYSITDFKSIQKRDTNFESNLLKFKFKKRY